jgi:type I restriction enzyme S subunit
MSFASYPKYTESGSERLIKIPSHWSNKRIKWVATLNDDVLSETTEPDYEIAYVDIGSVSLDSGIEKYELLKFKDAPSRARRLVRDGDVIVSTVRTYLKAIAPIRSPENNVVVSTGFSVIRPMESLKPEFIKYQVQSSAFIDEVISRSTGVSYPAINSSEIANIELPIPPHDEQIGIAKFLDHETAKIDKLVNENQKLIGLLKEKRRGVISKAVTKGLDNSVKLKDSNVEWLGKFPEQWSLSILRRSVQEHKQGYYSSDDYVDEGVKLLRITDLNGDGTINYQNCPLVNDCCELKEFLLKKGDFVFARTGGAGTFGEVKEIDENIAFASYLIRFRFSPELSPDFLHYYFQSDLFITGVESKIHGGVNKNIHAEDIKNQVIVFPDINEQKRIAAYLDTMTKKYSKLIDEAICVIDLLKERRVALISGAVSGQIDVRNYKIKEVA